MALMLMLLATNRAALIFVNALGGSICKAHGTSEALQTGEQGTLEHQLMPASPATRPGLWQEYSCFEQLAGQPL
eukprot:CAMPEP_0181488788 /NCGR_PEP_ID=MMETSP1110-20121109/48595_1 /TAXON_ID=174948 /ORGANISM="Symbiodinium sp., Strain CCMP421" /LENGTH=73 /DNA_ID=CAMNT_0023615497 /DNA_START=285 /DNA_END=507 /DNA_ORIENTATION=+